MGFDTKEMSGSIFNNTRKEKDTHPDRQGSCLIDGVHYWISGWVKKDKNGNPWMSLAFKRKDEVDKKPDTKQASTTPRRSMKDDLDDDVPF